MLKEPPAELTQACEAKQELPDRALTQAEVETLWRRDRANLEACGETLASLIEFYRKRDEGLRG